LPIIQNRRKTERARRQNFRQAPASHLRPRAAWSSAFMPLRQRQNRERERAGVRNEKGINMDGQDGQDEGNLEFEISNLKSLISYPAYPVYPC
jgi:hypothetical protein